MIDKRRFVWWDLCGVGATTSREYDALESGGGSERGQALWQRLQAIDVDQVWENRTSDLPEQTHIIELRLPLAVPTQYFYAIGDVSLLKRRSVAVVGTRHATSETKSLTECVVRQYADRCVVSGGARGTDAFAHRFALEYGAATIVVSPSGLSNLTPKSNRALFERIVESGGLILSEYAPRSAPRGFHFHRRNQVIVALSEHVIVVRCAPKSGSMLTARAAIETGTPLFAIPGSPLDPFALGCNQLIASGDATSMFDFVEQSTANVSADEAKLLDHLPATTDSLASALDQPIATLQTTLLELELNRVVRRDPMTGLWIPIVAIDRP